MNKYSKKGKKSYYVKNYLCKYFERQFVADHALKYSGCHSELYHKIKLMLVRNAVIRDPSEIENISQSIVLSVLTKSDKIITSKQKYVNVLKKYEFKIYVVNKDTKLDLNTLTTG
jgi:transposase-like protein